MWASSVDMQTGRQKFFQPELWSLAPRLGALLDENDRSLQVTHLFNGRVRHQIIWKTAFVLLKLLMFSKK